MADTDAPLTDEQLVTPIDDQDSMTTVVIAFVANVAVAIAKTIAAIVTGSASMTAEAMHSWADSGNEIFLLIAERRGNRGRTRSCLLYTSPSPRDVEESRMPSSA